MKELLIVSLGSFFGGGMRFLVSKLAQQCLAPAFPLGTFLVNVTGCLVIGFVSTLPIGGGMSPQTKLFLTTGFCGGFTTFSTFMNESLRLMEDGRFPIMALYILGSLAAGLLAVWAGQWLGKSIGL